MQIIKYTTEAEAEQIKLEKVSQGLVLVEIANITEGNYLGFDDHPRERALPIDEQVRMLEAENQQLKNRLQTTEQIAAETSSTQQQLIEILIDMEVI